MKLWNKINNQKYKDIDDEDTSGNLVQLVHQIDDCEDRTETEVFTWISSDIECNLTN